MKTPNIIIGELQEENERLKQWVDDLQSGMYINCVYCGHRYGPEDELPSSMADVLKEHVEQCPEHPMSRLKDRVKIVINQLNRMVEPEHEAEYFFDQEAADRVRNVLAILKGISDKRTPSNFTEEGPPLCNHVLAELAFSCNHPECIKNRKKEEEDK